MKGYLVLTKNGKEALIGGTCGDKYFQLNEQYNIDKNWLEREIEISSRIEQITKTLDQKYLSHLNKLSEQLNIQRREIFQLKTLLPSSVRKELQNMEKSKNPSVYIEIQYSEISDDGKRVQKWVSDKIGSINGTHIWLYEENIGTYFQLLHNLEETVPEIQPTSNTQLKVLRGWCRTLESIHEIDTAVQKISKSLYDFLKYENLALVTFLTKSRAEREMISKMICSYVSDNDISNDPELLLNNIDKRIRQNYDNRNFRII
ncbi:hypothetical protein [uncultured Methylophaga sp.]|uniref:hypothetical protein n=1 Tax=uncultured Methylophaga sp. TaxID=285271 RepID=UPI0026345460|nr:hypothetical protein [uncultured Methylophaga sp.]